MSDQRSRSPQRWRIARAVVICFSSVNCSSAFWQGFGEGLARTAPGNAGTPVAAPSTSKLMLFGGKNHKTYLGCLSCGQYVSDSVFNEYGTYGGKFSQTSIQNIYGEFGSANSVYSACNAYATDPPVIVDSAGKFYGRLTINASAGDAHR